MSWLLLFLYMTIGVCIGLLIDLLVFKTDPEKVTRTFVAIEITAIFVIITGAVFMGSKVV